MNKALTLTLQENKYQWITPDTIQSYRSHLSIDLLKSTSNLCYVMEDRRRGKNNSQLVNSANLLSSKEMLLNEHSIQSYANCSMADVLSMSNQRTSLTLTLMAMIWALASRDKARDEAEKQKDAIASGEQTDWQEAMKQWNEWENSKEK